MERGRAFRVFFVFPLLACGGTKYPLSVTLLGSGTGKVSANAARIDCSASCTSSLGAGSHVVLTATPMAGSDFTGWSGSCSGSGTCTVVMDGAKEVSARFSLSRAVFSSRRKLDGTDAVGPNGTFNIWRVNTDASGLTPITNVTAIGADNSDPQWSPDGATVVFASSRSLDGTDAVSPNDTPNIWLVNADGSGLTPLTHATALYAANMRPQWSPDGTRVVFDSPRNLDGTDTGSVNSSFNIWRVNSDGSALTPLTTVTRPQADNFAPQWSPDGGKVVFYSWRKLDGTDAPSLGGVFNIWRVDADGTGLTPLTNATAPEAHSFEPQWSPDNTKLAFYSERKLDGTDAANLNLTRNIWVVNADGTGLAPLTRTTARGADSTAPQWSPDGSRIAFESSRKLDGTDALNGNATSNIWVVNADGTGLTPLTRATASGASSFTPRWSPDGSKLVFSSTLALDGTDSGNPNSVVNIWRVNAEGSGLIPLTKATALGVDSYLPVFSP